MSRGTVRAFSPVAGLFLLAAATVVAACGGAEAPRIDVELTLDMPDSVPLDEPLHMTYTWAPGDDFEAPLDDYQVFVHVLDAYRNIVFQDDHYPTEPTSQWSTGQPQSYDRWLYLPTGLEVDRDRLHDLLERAAVADVEPYRRALLMGRRSGCDGRAERPRDQQDAEP